MKRLQSIFLFLIFSTIILSQTAEEIIEKAEESVKGTSAHGIIEMIVVTPDYERTLEMESWWIGNKKALIVIKSPRKERGNKTLKIRNEMWSYLKNTETTIKIPPSMMLQSWNGSDFTNDDLVRESNLSEDYFQEIAGVDTLYEASCWKIQLTPKPDAPVVWGKLYYWVRQKDYTPARVEYYDEKGKLIRHMVYSEIKKFGNRLLPSRWSMINDEKKGHSTEMKINEMEFDIKINERIFSFQELEKGN